MRILLSLVVPSLTLALAAPAAQAQLPDYTVADVDYVQILQSDSFALIGDRPTLVRVSVGATNPGDPAQLVDGLVRIFVNGVEDPQSPVFSTNGPFPATGSSDPELGTTTLTFMCMPPVSGNVVFEVEVNSPGPNFVVESNTANNTFTSAPKVFIARGTLDLAYAPIDLRPGGGATPNLPDNDLIKPGVGDNFIQGIYPGERIEYRRIDAPSKLWTSSVQGTGSSLNSSLNSDLFQMSPRPDFIYGWVPGGLPYNGQAFLNGKAAMGNTQTFRHQRTYAHELGHNFGRSHNSTKLNTVGVDVEHHLWVTEGLSKIKTDAHFDIMAAGLFTQQAWVASISLNPFFNHSVFNPPPAAATANDSGPQLMLSGVWNRETGALSLDPFVVLPDTEPVEPATPGTRDLVLRGFAGDRLVRELPISVRTSLDECPVCRPEIAADESPLLAENADSDSLREPEAEIHFVTLLPARGLLGESLDALEVVAAADAGSPVQTVRRAASAHAPQVELLSPAGEAVGSTLTIRWAASDADGDALHATVRYAPDGGTRRVPLATHIEAEELVVDLAGLPQFRAGAGFIELLVSDGFHTTRVESAPLQGGGAYAGAGGNPPFVEIYHPDDGRSFRARSKLVLHSSGWDLEDLALEGSSLQWTSDLDGALGSGRRLLVDDLSVGTHQITVTAMDSGGQTTQRTHSVNILDRGVPYGDDLVCAPDLGFGGPGSAQLSLCGSELATGGVADLRLENAAPNAPVFMLLGLNNNPVPAKGGVLVPIPWATILNMQTSGVGEVFVPGVVSSGGPLTFYLQAVVIDAGQALGYAFSNAIQVDF